MGLRIAFCLALFASNFVAFAGGTLDDLRLGKTIAGPNWTLDDLRGNVVLLDLWGSDGPLLVGHMPGLSLMYEKYKEDGFFIVEMNFHDYKVEPAVEAIMGKRIKQQVTIDGSFKGITNYPRRILIGADGNVISDNLPYTDYEKTVKTALAQRVSDVAGKGPYKKLTALAARAKSGKNLGAVLKELEPLKTSKDADEGAEATMMSDALNAVAKQRLDAAIRLRQYDVATSQARLAALAVLFAGSEPGTKAAQEEETTRKDPKTKDAIAADAMFNEIKNAEYTLKPVKKAFEPKSAEFRKLNVETLQRMIGGCNTLIQRYPGTSAAARGEELLKMYK